MAQGAQALHGVLGIIPYGRQAIGPLGRLRDWLGWRSAGARATPADVPAEARIERTISVLEREGDLVHLLATGPRGQLEVITRMTTTGDTLYLREFDITGPGASSQGIRELREFARALGRQEGVRTVVVEGRIRTTGSGPGRTPRPTRIEVQ